MPGMKRSRTVVEGDNQRKKSLQNAFNAAANTSATGSVVPNSPVSPDATGDAASTDARIGLARIPSGVFAGTTVPAGAISATHSPARLVAAPVQTPVSVQQQQPLPVTPDFKSAISMVDLRINARDGDEACSYAGVLIRGDENDVRLCWLPGDANELILSTLESPGSAMMTPPIRQVFATDFSPTAIPANQISARIKRINRKLSKYQAELSFFRAQLDHYATPPPCRITSVYSPVPARAQTVPTTPPTGSGTHSSPVVIGDSPVVLD